MSAFPQKPDIDFLILADKAEAINGKLYMMGGGWERLFVNDFAEAITVNLAIGILVPWSETNKNHPVIISLEHEDGTKVASDFQMAVNVGRPPTSVPGQSFRAIITVEAKWRLPGPSAYRVIAEIPGVTSKRTAFYAEPPGGARQ